MKSLFGADGALAREIEGYAPRTGQFEMAQAVATAIQQQETLVVEAGTGTGKTFAYLVPALLSGRRVVISTGTLNLQDQLFYRDLPRIRSALKAPGRVALLKGRANYLCRHRLTRAVQSAGRHEVVRLAELQQWARSTGSGEMQEQSVLREDDPLLPRVTSTADNCLGSRCTEFEQCFVVKARRAAQGADLLVINHHLLFADFMLREEGFGQVLPGADVVVVDEAHQVPEIASRFFGTRLATRQLNDLAEDTVTEATALRDVPDVRDAAVQLAEAVATLERCFGPPGARERFEQFAQRSGARAALDAVDEALHGLQGQLKAIADRTPGLSTLNGQALELRERLASLSGRGSEEKVAWVESFGRGGALNSTPVRVDADFGRLRESQPSAWVFTSATLAAGTDFGHFTRQLGLEGARCLRLPSPFDFEHQARLWLPAGLPNPNEPTFTARVTAEILPLIEASGGGAFVLCTSHRALREIAASLRGAVEYTVLVQGEGSRTELLQRFSADGHAVLVGTASFWEGVDVRGLALRLVIIDRLPFAAPGDPVFDARLAAIRESGGDPFNDFQLPQAITTLRQGVGRLIRDPEDRGLLVLCDPRLRSRPYGRKFLGSLPPAPQVENRAEAMAWLQSIRPAAPRPARVE